jgi:hypothetical protein
MSTGRGGSNKLSRNKRTEVQKRNRAARPFITEHNHKRNLEHRTKLHPKDVQALEALKKLL